MSELDVINTILTANAEHKREILDRLDDHKSDIDRQLKFQERQLRLFDKRMWELTETTNHRLDDFHAALEKKADKSALLTSMGFRLLSISWIRWAVGGLLTAAVTTMFANEWFSQVAKWIEGTF